jgi:hypothetical protein
MMPFRIFLSDKAFKTGKTVFVLRNKNKNKRPDSALAGSFQMDLFDSNISLCTHNYGEDPFAEISTMLWNAFLNATCTGLEGIHCQ